MVEIVGPALINCRVPTLLLSSLTNKVAAAVPLSFLLLSNFFKLSSPSQSESHLSLFRLPVYLPHLPRPHFPSDQMTGLAGCPAPLGNASYHDHALLHDLGHVPLQGGGLLDDE